MPNSRAAVPMLNNFCGIDLGCGCALQLPGLPVHFLNMVLQPRILQCPQCPFVVKFPKLETINDALSKCS